MLTIVDYDIGNLASLKNMLKKIGVESIIATTENEILSASKIILPGFGAFDTCAEKLQRSGLIPALKNKVLMDGVPVLGICVGMQLLFSSSEEGVLPGLRLIEGKNIKFKQTDMPSNLKIPHMGWSSVQIEKKSPLVDDLEADPRFYFGHSYHAVVDNVDDALVSVEYGYRFVAGVARNNIYGVQFHPEKSHRFGMKLLDNFVNRVQ
ncbi:MAG: imidazole glycerol phosphate synthase subunit HisH [Flammeovirgaceae bacterium]